MKHDIAIAGAPEACKKTPATPAEICTPTSTWPAKFRLPAVARAGENDAVGEAVVGTSKFGNQRVLMAGTQGRGQPEESHTGRLDESAIDSRLASSADVLGIGSVVGRYMVVERIGAGAMGVVYSAYDPKLDRKVALKLLRRRPDRGDQSLRQERLVREAKAIAKLSHPNIVGIFDVGIHQDEVFLAMEHLAGGTLKRWVAAGRRHWRDVVKMFIDVGRGLHAAHAEGLVHRDLKSENVLLDKTGAPKIVDFGLVRLMESVEPEVAVESTTDDVDVALPMSEIGVGPLTLAGAVLGTPAYMAPEQFVGKPADARTDQFAFCVSLYDALYGERPFAGDTISEIGESVSKGRVRPAPADSVVPGWLRRVILRGLATDPAQRYRNMSDLLQALAADPVARWRRRVAVTAGIVVAGAIIFGVQRRAEHRRAEFEQRIAVRMAEGSKAFSEAQAAREKLRSLRARAFALFDARDRDGGEYVWSQARTVSESFETALGNAQRALEAALALDQTRMEARERLAEVVFERAALAELELRREDLSRHLGFLDAIDGSGAYRQRWRQPGSLSVRTDPPGATIRIERFDGKPGARITPAPVEASLPSPVTGQSLPAGSYRLEIRKPGYVSTLYPVVVKRGETVSLNIALPPEGDIPAGFTYVPAGRFLYGDDDEDLRVSFLNAVPLHERELHGFVIKTHEVTFGEWIAFLSSLSPRERTAALSGSSAMHGAVVLRQARGDDWSLELNLSGHRLQAASGEKLVYPGRPKTSPAQDWLNIPVVGVSPKDMRKYLTWLAATGKLAGARFCTDTEWERAARGADERTYPSSYRRPAIGAANVDTTYGRTPGAYGLDEVGRYPDSRSPFGIDDMVGNAWEVVESDGPSGTLVARGGCYYNRAEDARSTNREPIEPDLRNHTMGFRVCADWPRATTESQR